MSHSEAPALSAIAFQFSAALQSYEEDMDRLVDHGVRADLYQRASTGMDTMRLYAASLTGLSVAWVEVLIRHFELTQRLVQEQRAGSGSPAEAADLRELQQRWRDAVHRLSRKCLQMFPSA